MRAAERQPSPRDFDAVIFDMDGVVTQTASVHSTAWKRMFDEYFAVRARRLGEPFVEFTHASDYLQHVDGRARYQGVANVLIARGIKLAFGSPSDAPSAETICGLGNRKNEIFNQLVESEGIAVYASTVRLLVALRGHGIRLALATSSRNSAMVLERTQTAEFFAAVVDGLEAERLGLKGKPEPDIFTTACARLGVPCDRAIVVEDAMSGVAAGAKGGFALTLGVARENNAAELLAQGADAVVTDLAEIDFDELNQLIQEKRASILLPYSPGQRNYPVRKKPLLSFWQLWNMSFGYIGIQFGFALQNSNLSRIFETLGAKQDSIPALWIAAPVSGLIAQPIIGYLSDRTWNRFGRRKPYFLAGAILASLSLLILPNSPALWVAAGMLWILDASINITMEPMRAFVGDMLSDEQRTQGFAVQTFFIGVASIVGSLLPWILTNLLHVSNTAPAGLIPLSVRWAFYSGGIIYISAVLWSIFSTQEYSPEDFEAYNAPSSAAAAKETGTLTLDTAKYYTSGIILMIVGLILTLGVSHFAWDKALYILSIGIGVYGALQLLAARLFASGQQRGLVEIVYDLNNMPKTMRQLAVAAVFTWFAMFAWFIYCTPAITSFHFGTSDPLTKAYNDGADWVGVLNSVYNGVAALVAFLLPVIARKTSRVATHAMCLVIGGLGLISLRWFVNPHWLVISMAGLGIGWAGLLTLPYAILSSVVPYRKMGVYMGMFNFFVVIPQIVAAAVLGLLVRTVFHGQAIDALVLGGISMLVAAGLMLRVRDQSRPNGSL